jgi:tetratricopeptide (TPR) repeat protein/tRNA A-37 threonylcarbamoyl transferase component Bud32
VQVPGQVGRYRIESEIARGGMGVVLRAHDTRLNRPLAIKVLRERHLDQPDKARRFLEEAQITARLQHPGIPPIHEVGTLSDGRPFLAMKLVQGRTLASLLQERPARGAELTRYLAVFEHVCHTLAFAHARGVVHRDLKPANVMVGEFDEVQLMDWGLARLLAEPDGGDTATRALDTVRTSPPPQKEVGHVVGTPQFLAPEQARGECVDARADVFGLGGILCAILTGHPPHAPGPTPEVVRRAAAGDLSEAHARLDACGADPELVRLARLCLAPRRDDRPLDAGAVARAVAEYQESVRDRLRWAELERARAEVSAREERKRRRVTAWLALAVLALAALAASGIWRLERQRAVARGDTQRQEDRTREAAERALDRLAELREQARWEEAEATLTAALRLLEEGPAALRRRLEEAGGDLALARELDAIRARACVRVRGRCRVARSPRDHAELFARRGLDPATDPTGVARRIRTSTLHARLVAALDDWAAATRDPAQRRRLLEVARTADPGAWQDRLRDPATWDDLAALTRLARECDLARTSPHLIVLLAGRLLARGGDGLDLLRRAQRERPGDLRLSLALGGALHDRPGRQEEAAGYYRAALASRPHAATAHANLADLLRRRGDVDGALAAAQRASALDPGSARVQANLGLVLLAAGRPVDAQAPLRRAVEIDDHLAEAHGGLGVALALAGNVPDALAAARRAVALEPALACAYTDLGTVLLRQGDPPGALAAYRRAVDLDPGPVAAAELAFVFLRQRAFDPALEMFRRALARDPHDARVRAGLAEALEGKGQRDEAVAEYRLAALLDDRQPLYPERLAVLLERKGDRVGLAAALRRVVELRPASAVALTNLGAALHDIGDHLGAEAALRRAIALEPRLALAHYDLGLVLEARRDPKGAEAAYNQALELEPREARALVNLGRIHFLRHETEKAIDLTRQGLAIDPKLAIGHANMGSYLLARGDFAASAASSRRALELLPKNDPRREGVTDRLRKAERRQERN